MSKNLAIKQIVLKYLSELTPEETKQIIKEAQGKLEAGIVEPEKRGGAREVNLCSIQAESDFDEMMQIFKITHPLTEIY